MRRPAQGLKVEKVISSIVLVLAGLLSFASTGHALAPALVYLCDHVKSLAPLGEFLSGE